MMLAHRGIFIATPEYNASMPPLLKNTLDWISRAKEPAADPFKGRFFAIGSTSNGAVAALLPSSTSADAVSTPPRCSAPRACPSSAPPERCRSADAQPQLTTSIVPFIEAGWIVHS